MGRRRVDRADHGARFDPARALLRWFDRNRRDLPWRRDLDPYRRWVAEVFLQQTRVAQVVPRYERFLARFPTVERLAAASLPDVLKAWEGAGYYARARHLHSAARAIAQREGVRWPRSAQEWQELPGVGPYIANSLASRILEAPVLALEANGLRVAARWTLERGDPRTASTRGRLAAHLGRWIPRERPGDFNEAVMELGETICRPARPRCPECPVAPGCLALHHLTDPGTLPMRPAKRPKPHVEASIVSLERDGKFLVHRRPGTGLLGGLWELPGGKLETGEQPLEAMRRELREETGLGVRSIRGFGSLRHQYSHFSVELHVFRGLAVGRFRSPDPSEEYRWVTPAEFDRLPRPLATIRAVRRIGSSGGCPTSVAPRRAATGHNPGHREPI